MSELLSQMPLQLEDDLVLRFATTADADAIGAFNTEHHDDNKEFGIVGRGVHHLVSGKHPTIRAEDFTIVEHAPTGRIVSSMCLLSQRWTYGGVEFPMGQPEFVATDKEYRRRGLVRKQFDVLHELSASRGEQMQGITGIPWYYSQFGYDMAMDLGGDRSVHRVHLRDAIKEPACRLRPSVSEDEEFVRRLYAAGAERNPFGAVRSDEMWQYELQIGRDKGCGAGEWQIIESPDGDRIGYLAHEAWIEWRSLPVFQLELVSGACYLNIMPSLLRALLEHGQAMVETDAHPMKEMEGVHLGLGRKHPAYDAVASKKSRDGSPYAWFIRVPDLVGFLGHVRAGLERNLIGTPAEGYTGALEISFYRSGVRIVLDRGAITTIEEWYSDDARIHLPREMFTHLLCGRRRCAELSGMFADCSIPHIESIVLDALFPPFEGSLWAIN
ncbi:hypothetical protein CMK11_18460 [Candidatus Poribacteria bacterium]|jgi:hypothetical protein|nr:hypothetical protein [Candidatus Poribacteria bacterium]